MNVLERVVTRDRPWKLPRMPPKTRSTRKRKRPAKIEIDELDSSSDGEQDSKKVRWNKPANSPSEASESGRDELLETIDEDDRDHKTCLAINCFGWDNCLDVVCAGPELMVSSQRQTRRCFL
jgi:hypothetical protein